MRRFFYCSFSTKCVRLGWQQFDFSDGPFDGPNGRGLLLKKGVVIRGETPLLTASATRELMPLRTTFIFPSQVMRKRLIMTLPAVMTNTKTIRVMENGKRVRKKVTEKIDFACLIDLGAACLL